MGCCPSTCQIDQPHPVTSPSGQLASIVATQDRASRFSLLLLIAAISWDLGTAAATAPRVCQLSTVQYSSCGTSPILTKLMSSAGPMDRSGA
jgi:hypothetical protein